MVTVLRAQAAGTPLLDRPPVQTSLSVKCVARLGGLIHESHTPRHLTFTRSVPLSPSDAPARRFSLPQGFPDARSRNYRLARLPSRTGNIEMSLSRNGLFSSPPNWCLHPTGSSTPSVAADQTRPTCRSRPRYGVTASCWSRRCGSPRHSPRPGAGRSSSTASTG